jgi:hypothetical protein
LCSSNSKNRLIFLKSICESGESIVSVIIILLSDETDPSTKPVISLVPNTSFIWCIPPLICVSLYCLVLVISCLSKTPALSSPGLFLYYRFVKISGILIGEEQHLKISSTDTITQVIYWGDRLNKKGKKVPGWWIFSRRRLEQAITCKNPSNKIIYSKTILITK